jgi:predicted transcriptional regulator
MKRDKVHEHVTCPNCGGTGRQLVVSGKKLRALREAAGVSLRELAARAGLSPAYVSDLELGRRNCSPGRLESYLVALEGHGRG